MIRRATRQEADRRDGKAWQIARALAPWAETAGITPDDVWTAFDPDIWKLALAKTGLTRASRETRGLALGKLSQHLHDQARENTETAKPGSTP